MAPAMADAMTSGGARLSLIREDPAEDDGQPPREQEAHEGRGCEGRQEEDERVGGAAVEVDDEADQRRHRTSFRRLTADPQAGLVVSRLERLSGALRGASVFIRRLEGRLGQGSAP